MPYYYIDVIIGSCIGYSEIEGWFIGSIPLEIGKGSAFFININGITSGKEETTKNNYKTKYSHVEKFFQR